MHFIKSNIKNLCFDKLQNNEFKYSKIATSLYLWDIWAIKNTFNQISKKETFLNVKLVLPEGLEPSIIDPKSIVISTSPWKHILFFS